MSLKIFFTILTSSVLPIAIYGIAANEVDLKKLKQEILDPSKVSIYRISVDDSTVLLAYQERLKLYKEQCQVKITDPQCSFNNLNELAHLIECVKLYNDMEAIQGTGDKWQDLRAHYMFRGYNAYWQAIYKHQKEKIA